MKLILLTVPLTGCTILRQPQDLGLPPKTVVLTFDDGPNGSANVTGKLLDVLATHHVKASFCIIGKVVEQEADLVRRIDQDGHDLVNHSYSHYLPLTRSRAGILMEIERGDAAIATALGQPDFRASFYRPPYGIISSDFARTLSGKGITIAPVTFFISDTFVGPGESDRLTKKLLKNIRKEGGGVIVIHDNIYRGYINRDSSSAGSHHGVNRTWVPEAVDRIITELSADGYRFLSFSELLEERDGKSTF